MKLHLGCGRTRLDGYTNVDCVHIDGVTDVVCDLDGPDLANALEPDSVSESIGFHVLEHLTLPLEFMQALWTVTEPGGTAKFEVPYGSSDDAWEDPTHRRPYFLNSWIYFSQPAYWRADYGYGGDWKVTDLVLLVEAARWQNNLAGLMPAVMTERNVVRTMTATLTAVKPARPAGEPDDDPLPLRFEAYQEPT